MLGIHGEEHDVNGWDPVLDLRDFPTYTFAVFVSRHHRPQGDA